MKNTHSIIGVALILLTALFTITPVNAQEQTIDENGYMDMPKDGEEIDFSGVGDYFQQLNQVETNTIDPGFDPATPVDGGLSLLLAAGLGYGANRLRKKREEKRNFDK